MLYPLSYRGRATSHLRAASRTLARTGSISYRPPTDLKRRPREPLLRVADEFVPDALHNTTQDANNSIENDHGRLKRGSVQFAACTPIGPRQRSFAVMGALLH